jgi:hypothetical protein
MNALGQEARALLDSVTKLDEPTLADKARVRARISAELGVAAFATLAVSAASSGAIATSAAPAAGAATSGASASALHTGGGVAQGATWPLLSKLALSGAALTLVAGALWLGGERSGEAREAHGKRAAQASSSAPQPAPAPEQASAEPAPQEQVQPSEPAPQPVAALGAEPAKSKRGTTQRKSEALVEPTAAPEASTLGAELKMLGEAQAALRAGAPERALALAAEHRASYPTGVMKEERDGIEVLAGCALGRDYRAQAEAFVHSARNSPLTARVRKACGLEP